MFGKDRRGHLLRPSEDLGDYAFVAECELCGFRKAGDFKKHLFALKSDGTPAADAANSEMLLATCPAD